MFFIGKYRSVSKIKIEIQKYSSKFKDFLKFKYIQVNLKEFCHSCIFKLLEVVSKKLRTLLIRKFHTLPINK